MSISIFTRQWVHKLLGKSGPGPLFDETKETYSVEARKFGYPFIPPVTQSLESSKTTAAALYLFTLNC